MKWLMVLHPRVLGLQVPNSPPVLSLIAGEVGLAKKKKEKWVREGRVAGKKSKHFLFLSLVAAGKGQE